MPAAPDVLTQATMQALSAPTWSRPAHNLDAQPDDRNQAAFPAELPSGLPLPIDPFGGR